MLTHHSQEKTDADGGEKKAAVKGTSYREMRRDRQFLICICHLPMGKNRVVDKAVTRFCPHFYMTPCKLKVSKARNGLTWNCPCCVRVFFKHKVVFKMTCTMCNTLHLLSILPPHSAAFVDRIHFSAQVKLVYINGFCSLSLQVQT